MCVAIFCVTEVSQATWQLFIAAWVSSAGKLAQLHMMWLVHSDNSSVNKASYWSANPSLCSFIWPPRSFRCFLLLGRVCHNDVKFKNLNVILILCKTFLTVKFCISNTKVTYNEFPMYLYQFICLVRRFKNSTITFSFLAPTGALEEGILCVRPSVCPLLSSNNEF